MPAKTPSGMLAVALDLAKQGYRVFPVKEGRKHPPLIKDWPTRATTNPAQIIQWWTMWAYANVAICTGDGVVVLDFDCRDGKQGMETYKAWLEQGLLDTLRVITPSNGRHCFFKTDKPLKCSIGTVAPDVDVKGEHGYVVAVGSILSGGLRYVPDHTGKSAASRLPERLYELCLAAEAKASTAKPNVVHIHSDLIDSEVARHRVKMYLVNEAPEAVQGQRGDETTFKVIQQVRAPGVTENVAYELILGYYNDQKCFPAWTAEELRIKVANAYKYVDRSGPIGARNPDIEFEGYLDPSLPTPEPKVKADDDDKQPNVFAETETAREEKAVEELFDADEPKWLALDDNDNKPIPEVHHLVADWFPFGEAGLFPAYGGLGKSTLMIQLLCCVAAGIPWCGMPTQQGKAVYVCAEDGDVAVERRVMLAMRHYGLSFKELYRKQLFIWALGNTESEPLMFATDDEERMIRRTKLFEKFMAWAERARPSLIILDPLSHIFDGEENKRKHARFTMKQARLLAYKSGAVVVILQHPSVEGLKSGRGSSGSTGWHGGARFQLVMEKTGLLDSENPFNVDRGMRRLTIQKSQYGQPGQFVDLRFKDGLFLPVSASERQMQDELVRDVFFELLARTVRDGNSVSPKSSEHDYAPKVFARMLKREDAEVRATQDQLETAMHELLKAEKIHWVAYKSSSRHQKHRLMLGSSSEPGSLFS